MCDGGASPNREWWISARAFFGLFTSGDHMSNGGGGRAGGGVYGGYRYDGCVVLLSLEESIREYSLN